MVVVKIGDKLIGGDHPCYILAEAGCNHNQNLNLAQRLVDMAAAAEADAVKFQTYHAEKMYSRKTPMMAHFRRRLNVSDDATMFDLIKMTELPWEMHPPLVDYCRQKRMNFLSTPFDLEAVELLESLNVLAYKIASFEITHYPLLRKVAQCGKPVILSTGMSNLGDIEKALSVIYAEGNEQVVLLHCVSNYPASLENSNLKVINTLKAAFGCPVGLSDHTPGTKVAEVAIAFGADLVEKHITVDQTLSGPDHYFSLVPEELKTLVTVRDEIEKMLGSPFKHCTEDEVPMKRVGQRSMVAANTIKKGQVIRAENIAIKRPGTGLHPELNPVLIGAVAQCDIVEDSPLDWSMVVPYEKNR